MSITMRFPGGLYKAFTMSYDDGVKQDVRLVEIMKKHGLSPSDMLVVDDMKAAVSMARAAGAPIAFAGWGRTDFPEITREMTQLCDMAFDSTQALYDFLFEE